MEAEPRSPLATLLGAITFYTCVPLPPQCRLNFHGIARWAPIVGVTIGGVLGLLAIGLHRLAMPHLTASVIVILAWVAITGGLHLDGAIDTADGLAVLDPERRLAVMADSRTGAFGVIAVIAILLLKTVALAELTLQPWLALMIAAGWGRWAQLWTIVRYPYLKPAGKGALHKAAIHSYWETLPSLALLLGLSSLHLLLNRNGLATLKLTLGGAILALLTGAWFNHKLGGHTGDTYGAVVEWTEALLLAWLTIV